MRTFKKPFNETKAGRILTNPLVKGALNMIPFGIGSTIGSILDKNGTDEGQVDPQNLVQNLMKVAVYAVLIYLVFSGRIDMDQAETAKEFINQ